MPQTRRIALLTVTRIFDPLNSDDDVRLLATSSSFLPSFLPPALNPSFGVGLMRECPAASVHTRALMSRDMPTVLVMSLDGQGCAILPSGNQ